MCKKPSSGSSARFLAETACKHRHKEIPPHVNRSTAKRQPLRCQWYTIIIVCQAGLKKKDSESNDGGHIL
ncbi:hypothetical protein AOLI_G00139830 [Acnodon oligacanthus]